MEWTEDTELTRWLIRVTDILQAVDPAAFDGIDLIQVMCDAYQVQHLAGLRPAQEYKPKVVTQNDSS